MQKTAIYLLFLLFLNLSLPAQDSRPYKCGFVPRKADDIQKLYEEFGMEFGVRKGEKVASIGASNGYFEMQMAAFVPGVSWYLEDIDSTCLNAAEVGKVRSYLEKLLGRPVDGAFQLVLGTESETGLEAGAFDRVLLGNVYHELSDPEPLLREIRGLLKPGGELVIMEKTGRKPGIKRNDCGHEKLFEPVFLRQMESFGFDLKKTALSKGRPKVTFFTFGLSG